MNYKIIMKNFIILIVVFFLFISPVFSEKKELNYSANKIQYEISKNKITLRGNSTVEYKSMTLKADTIYFFTEKEILLAEGNIDFASESNDFSGKKLLYDLNSQKAILYNARAPIEKGEVSGDTILYEDEKYLYGENTSFTTCKKINPHYSIKSKKMKVIKNNKIVVSPLIFYIGHVPVFYLPSYFIPIPEKRKSGFLQPQISNNKVDGISYTQPFFLVLNRFSDLTYTFKYMSKRGLKQTAEIRYKTQNGSGNLEGEYLDDNISNRERWQFTGTANHLFKPSNIKLSFKANFFSDQNYFSDFGENIYDRTRNQASSYLVLEKNFSNNIYTKLKTSHFQSWQNTESGYTEEVKDSLPQFNAILYSTQILPKLYISANSVTENLYINNSFKQISFQNDIDLTYKHTLFKHFQFTENLTNNLDYYKLESTQMKRWIPNFNLSSYFKIYGYFNILNIGASDKIKHIITPRISYNYIPDLTQQKFKNNNLNPINESSTLNYSISNSFLTKITESKKHTFLTFSTSTNQNLLKKTKQFSNLSNSAEITPYINEDLRLSLKFFHQYNIYEKNSENFSTYLSAYYNTKNLYSNIILNYSKNYESDNKIASLRSNTNLKITKNWRLTHNLLYDIEANEIRNQSFGLSRDLHCWKINIEWENRENGLINYKFFIGLKAFKDLKWDYTQEIKTGKEQYDW